MTLLEIDPNVVKPGWTPLLIIIGIACVMVLLYLSMRRQFKRISVPGGATPRPGFDADGTASRDVSPGSSPAGADGSTADISGSSTPDARKP